MSNSVLSNPLERFWRLLKPDRSEIRSVYIYAVFIGLLNLTLPIGIQAIINLIQGGAVSTSWIVLVFLVSLGIAIGGILQINQLKITENLQQKIFTRASFEFAYRIPKIKLEQLFKKYAPELMNRFFDVMSVQKGLSKILIDFSSASIQVLFGLVLLSVYHPFFIVFSLLLVVLIFFILRLTARKGWLSSLEESKRKYEVAHWLEELARTNITFKLAGKTDLPLKRVNQSTGKYIESREEHFSVLLRQYSLMVIFKVVVALGLLLIGGLLVIEQQMNIGQFVAAEIIILIMINSVEKLILSFETIYDVLTALEKIGQVTDLELEESQGLDTKVSDQGIEIELGSASYVYPEEKRAALTEINLKVKPGERIYVTGEKDSGKSTLLYLMSGLIKPVSGYVSFNDIPVENYNYDSLRSRIGVLLRDERLFEGSLLENITIGRERATFENVQWAVEKIGLSELVKNLPQGYDTLILPHGRQFSKSALSKILLARAIADKPDIILLENSFLALAEDDRKQILEFILDKSLPWTVVLSSSHPLGMNHLIDREIVMEKGKIKN